MSPIPPTRNEALGIEVVEPNEKPEAQSEDIKFENVKPDTKEKDNTNVMQIIKKWKGKKKSLKDDGQGKDSLKLLLPGA